MIIEIKSVSVIKLAEQKNKRKLLSLMEQFNEEYQQRLPTHGFKSIALFDSYTYYISDFQIKRLDEEVTKQNDFMVISDIKEKHGELSISYTAINDYDDLIQSLGNLG
ncbi:hypothetical protein BM527_04560 [Alteromonas sp. Mex14]|nr:hypothetical protein BM527_04560 [Alteromonas sp. Mex14]